MLTASNSLTSGLVRILVWCRSEGPKLPAEVGRSCLKAEAVVASVHAESWGRRQRFNSRPGPRAVVAHLGLQVTQFRCCSCGTKLFVGLRSFKCLVLQLLLGSPLLWLLRDVGG